MFLSAFFSAGHGHGLWPPPREGSGKRRTERLSDQERTRSSDRLSHRSLPCKARRQSSLFTHGRTPTPPLHSLFIGILQLFRGTGLVSMTCVCTENFTGTGSRSRRGSLSLEGPPQRRSGLPTKALHTDPGLCRPGGQQPRRPRGRLPAGPDGALHGVPPRSSDCKERQVTSAV